MIYIVEYSYGSYDPYSTHSVHTTLLGENGAMKAANDLLAKIAREGGYGEAVRVMSGKSGQRYNDFEEVELFDESLISA